MEREPFNKDNVFSDLWRASQELGTEKWRLAADLFQAASNSGGSSGRYRSPKRSAGVFRRTKPSGDAFNNKI